MYTHTCFNPLYTVYMYIHNTLHSGRLSGRVRGRVTTSGWFLYQCCVPDRRGVCGSVLHGNHLIHASTTWLFIHGIVYLQEDLGDSNLEVRTLPEHSCADLLAGLFLIWVVGEELGNKVLVPLNEPAECVPNWIASLADADGLHHPRVSELTDTQLTLHYL